MVIPDPVTEVSLRVTVTIPSGRGRRDVEGDLHLATVGDCDALLTRLTLSKSILAAADQVLVVDAEIVDAAGDEDSWAGPITAWQARRDTNAEPDALYCRCGHPDSMHSVDSPEDDAEVLGRCLASRCDCTDWARVRDAEAVAALAESIRSGTPVTVVDDVDAQAGRAGRVPSWQGKRASEMTGAEAREVAGILAGVPVAPAGVTVVDDEPDVANAYFLPERAAELLAIPAPTAGGRHGEVVSLAQILFRDGLTVIDLAGEAHIEDAIAEDRARLLRTWDVDWTGDDIHVVNEVHFTGHQSVPVDPPGPETLTVRRPHDCPARSAAGTLCIYAKGIHRRHLDEGGGSWTHEADYHIPRIMGAQDAADIAARADADQDDSAAALAAGEQASAEVIDSQEHAGLRSAR